MKKLAMASFVALASSSVLAFGQPGAWTSGWGMGITEYQATVNDNNKLYIACDPFKPVTMTLTVNGREYGSYEQNNHFGLIIDGVQVNYPYLSSNKQQADTFYWTWNALRKAKSLVAVTSDGQQLKLPVKGSSKTLGEIYYNSECRTAYYGVEQ